ENQAKSDWDVFHPGRMRGLGKQNKTPQMISEAIVKHLSFTTFAETQAELKRIAARVKKYY
ncbi:MAG: hypothetical protein ACREVD_03545, partial [Burkholderiales bacterium]